MLALEVDVTGAVRELSGQTLPGGKQARCFGQLDAPLLEGHLLGSV